MAESEAVSLETGVAAHGSLAGQHQKPHPGCNILFLCRDNSALSIMAQALLGRCEGRGFRAFSAGSHPANEVHPIAADLLKANGIWSRALKPKDCGRFLDHDSPSVDFVISLGAQAPAGMPSSWPGDPQVLHWRISEPRADGSQKENLLAFRKTFTELETRIKLFVLVNERKARKKISAQSTTGFPQPAHPVLANAHMDRTVKLDENRPHVGHGAKGIGQARSHSQTIGNDRRFVSE
jgi:arsenate reductase (thioredoxin)